jgi:hypothetical protein
MEKRFANVQIFVRLIPEIVRQNTQTNCFQSVDAVWSNVVFFGEYARECTTVLDRSNGTERHEIARNAPPPVRFSHNICFSQLLIIRIAVWIEAAA